MKTYEALLIFDESIKEDVLSGVLDRIRDEMVKLGGTVKGSDIVGKRAFSRVMDGKSAGLYVKVTFSLLPEKMDLLRVRLRLSEEIFRLQITSVDEARRARLAEAKKKRRVTETTATVDREIDSPIAQ